MAEQLAETFTPIDDSQDNIEDTDTNDEQDNAGVYMYVQLLCLERGANPITYK